MKAVLDLSKLEGTGSKSGWSWHLRWLGCTMKAHLLDTLPPKRVEEATPQFFMVGTIVHKLLDIHESHTGYQDITFKNVSPFLREPADEAWEIFRHYRAHYAPGWWGIVLARELHLEHDGYTGQIDVVLKIATKEHIRHWYDVGVVIAKGVYIQDYKTFTPPWSPNDYRDSPQFTGYYDLYIQHLHNARIGRPRGTLITGINKSEKKAPPVKGLFIPPPGPRQMNIWDQQLILSATRKEESDEDGPQPNLAHCGYGNHVCPFKLKECPLEDL